MTPAGLSSIRLWSGAARLIRRLAASSVRARWSYSGSYPRSESLKPYLPFSDPWQVPALQPILDSTGITSRTKLGSNLPARPETASGTEIVLSPRANVICPWPSALGRTSSVGETVARSSVTTGSTMRVTSIESPSASCALTRTCA